MISWLQVDASRYVPELAKCAQNAIDCDVLAEAHKVFADSAVPTRLFHANRSKFLVEYRKLVSYLSSHVFGEDLVFQAVPNLRFQFPGDTAVDSWHRDSDFGHSLDEVNLWIPLTEATDSSTIWIETSQGATSYIPVLVPVGRCLVFDGANLSHGNVLNDSSRTRVSFDFRVVRKSQYRDREDVRSIRHGLAFKVGEYFQSM